MKMLLRLKSSGPGRGWWGPPKGSHTAQAVPGGKVEERDPRFAPRKRRGVKRKKPSAKAKPKAELKPQVAVGGGHPLITTPEGEAKIRSFESEIVGMRRGEHAGFFDETGFKRFEKTNLSGSFIQFTEDEKQTIQRSAQFSPIIMTHNHPEFGSSFSLDDIRVAINWNLAEIRAVGQHPLTTNRYLYRLTRPGNSWGDVSKLSGRAFDVDTEIKYRFWSQAKAGTLAPRVASFEHYHEMWKTVAGEQGWQYSRTKL